MAKVYGYTQYQADFSNSQDEPKSKNLRRPRTNRTPDACDQKKNPPHTHHNKQTEKQKKLKQTKTHTKLLKKKLTKKA